jgi:hypothetical protein
MEFDSLGIREKYKFVRSKKLSEGSLRNLQEKVLMDKDPRIAIIYDELSLSDVARKR